MSLGWVITGTIGELLLACMLFMIVGFSGASLDNQNNLSQFQSNIIDFAIYALPATCVLCACIVLYFYKNSAGASAYWWYGAPLVPATLYIIFAIKLSN